MSWRHRLTIGTRVAGKTIVVLASLTALVLIIAAMSGYFRTKTEPGEAPLAQPLLDGQAVARVHTLSTTQSVDSVGTVQPRRKTEVASRLLAVINDVAVDAGDSVTAGQLLCTLDDRELQAQLREAEASAAGIEADLNVREREYQRKVRMFKDKAVTKEDVDRSEGAYLMAQAQLQRMKEQANRFKVMLTYAQIESQAAGVVADRYADPGDLAVPGKPLLTIHDPQALELHANVREGLSGNVRLNQRLPVSIDALGRTVEGTIREIVPRADSTSRSLLVKITLPAKQLSGIYIGMFGRVSIPVTERQRLVIPRQALQVIGQLTLVDVVLPDAHLQRRFVRAGQLYGDQVEILSGLTVGDTVAVPTQSAEKGQGG